jgi:hypothetical protein
MGAVAWVTTSTGVVCKEIVPNMGYKMIFARLPATFVNGTDTFAIDLTPYGCSKIAGVLMFQETTAGSVTLQSAVSATLVGVAGLTTAVSSGTLTITPLLPANTCITNFIIFAY